MEFREFNKNDADEYAGACDFSDGEAPQIARIAEDRVVIIAGDPDGVERVMLEVFFYIRVSDADDYDLFASFCRYFDTFHEAVGSITAYEELDHLKCDTMDKFSIVWKRVH